jgi:DNA-binding transcriptional LysR family regulator
MHRPWYEVSKYDVCGPMICISAPIQTSAVIDAIVVDADPRRAKPTSCRVLDIVIDDGLSDIVAGRFDAGIRIGERLEKDMIAVRLTPDVKMMAVASPKYLARHGEPKVPADLHRHACINWRFPGSGAIYRWPMEKKNKRLELEVSGPLISNLQEVVVEGALQGLGILYVYDVDPVHEWIAAGRLKRVLADWSPTFPGLFLYYSGRRHLHPALRAFIDCLLDRDSGTSKQQRSRTIGT